MDDSAKKTDDIMIDPRVKLADDGKTVSIELDYAITLGAKDTPITLVTVRRATAGDLENADKAGEGVASTVVLVKEVTGLSLGVVRRMDAADFGRVAQLVQAFSGKGSATGGNA